jgi:hypothetical protein
MAFLGLAHESPKLTLRYSYEDAGGIIEDLDTFGWGAACSPLRATPATEPRGIDFRSAEHFALRHSA